MHRPTRAARARSGRLEVQAERETDEAVDRIGGRMHGAKGHMYQIAAEFEPKWLRIRRYRMPDNISQRYCGRFWKANYH